MSTFFVCVWLGQSRRRRSSSDQSSIKNSTSDSHARQGFGCRNSFKSFIQCVFHRPKKKRRAHKRSCLVMSWLTLSRRLCYCFGGQSGNGAKGKQMRAQMRVKSVTRCGEPHWSANRELLSENRLISLRGELILQNLHIYENNIILQHTADRSCFIIVPNDILRFDDDDFSLLASAMA